MKTFKKNEVEVQLHKRYRKDAGCIHKRTGEILIVLHTKSGDFFQLTGHVAEIFLAINARKSFLKHAKSLWKEDCPDYKDLNDMLDGLLKCGLIESVLPVK